MDSEVPLLRKILFWAHLCVGVAAAAVVVVMALTGTLLTYERQTIEWVDRDLRSNASATGTTLAPEEMVRAIRTQTGAMPDSITFRAAPGSSLEATIGPRTLYVDSATGRVLGEGSGSIRRFFRSVTQWHRWLAMEGDWRLFGRSVTGAANLGFLLLALTGMFLWLPRKRTSGGFRAVLWFRNGLSGKARDFNWHNVIGIWCALPLIAVIVGAVVISYPWATNVVYWVAGSQPPAPTAAPPQRAPRPSAPGGDGTGLNQAVAQAQRLVPEWQTISWRAAAGPNVTLAVAQSHRGRVDLRSTLIISRVSGGVVRHEQFTDYSRGRQWRLWLRFIHTGEALGVVGQTIAGIVSAATLMLAWTGLALTWRRWRGWQSRRKRGTAEADIVAVNEPVLEQVSHRARR